MKKIRIPSLVRVFPKTGRTDILFSILVGLFYSLFGGSLVTYDGRQYLASANSFLEGSLDSGYLFGRPPMYPFFLSLVFRVSDSDRFLIFIQVLLVCLSVLFFVRSLNKYFVAKNLGLKFPLVAAYILITAPTLAGYGSTVLQQSLFVSEAAILSAVTLLIFTEPYKKRLYFVLCTVIAITLLTGQGMIPFIFGIIVTILISLILFVRNDKTLILRVIPFFLALLMVVPATLTLWSSFEKWGTARPGAVVIALPSGASLTSFPKYFAQDPSLAIDNLLEAFASQSGLIPAIQAKGLIAPNGAGPSRFFENRVHAENVFSPSRSCGIMDTNNVGVWDRFSKGVIDQSCAPFALPVFIQSFVYGLGALLSIVSTLFIPIGLMFLFLILRNFRSDHTNWLILLILPSILLRGSYLFLGFQPDRYALPTLPFAIILTWLTYFALKNQFLVKKSTHPFDSK